MALGTVGGLTSLHPLAKHSIEMLGNPSAKELMMITATMGLANNFSAIKSLVTKGIQTGHMKMHLMNILNHFKATEKEKEAGRACSKRKRSLLPWWATTSTNSAMPDANLAFQRKITADGGYLVLDGAKALAIPVNKGQSLRVEQLPDTAEKTLHGRHSYPEEPGLRPFSICLIYRSSTIPTRLQLKSYRIYSWRAGNGMLNF